jgi:hypothetical protein
LTLQVNYNPSANRICGLVGETLPQKLHLPGLIVQPYEFDAGQTDMTVFSPTSE